MASFHGTINVTQRSKIKQDKIRQTASAVVRDARQSTADVQPLKDSRKVQVITSILSNISTKTGDAIKAVDT